jgi:putative peptide zinc metalloprotease protein
VLCSSCRRQIGRESAFCGTCGAPRPGAAAPLELVLQDGSRIPIADEVIIGRAPGSTIQLDDPTVSRTHARITSDRNGLPFLEDAGSSLGTLLDGATVTSPVPLRDGAKVQIGAQSLGVERYRDVAEAGRTIVVRPGASLMVSAVGAAGPSSAAATTSFGMKPRIRSGYALKRLEESEGSKRWVLRDLNTGKFLRLSDRDAEIFRLLDGEHSLVDIIGHAEESFGGMGAVRVARLLSDLGERGFLAGVASSQAQAEPMQQSFIKRLIGPREKSFSNLGKVFDPIYSKGGWLLFTRPALVIIALLIVGGIASFGYLIAARYGTPFVVGKRIGIGALVFLIGRFLVVAVHETAHGLTMASFGRKIDKVGLKFMFVLPYAFVDTNEAWFEPRKRRIAISGAGPVSDFALGGIFSICSLVSGGTVRDVFFQLAFAGYIGAFFNLNPFLDRDGYQMVVDVLREPGLKKRAKDQFERRLSGRKAEGDSPVLARFSLFGLLWGVVGAGFAIFMSHRYSPVMKAVAPDWVVTTVLTTIAVVVFLPVLFVVAKPLRARFRGNPPEPAEAVG